MKDTCSIPATTCPKCGRSYSAPSAISREDNRTPICPDCGIRESLASIGCTQEEQDHILELVHEYESRRNGSSEVPFAGYELRNKKRLQQKDTPIQTLGDLYEVLTHSWRANTAYPADQKYWSKEVPSYGQCAITAMLVYDIFGGELYRTLDHSHYFNRIDGHWVDLTAHQFWAYGDRCNYDAGEKVERRYVGRSGHTRKRYDMLVQNITEYLGDVG